MITRGSRYVATAVALALVAGACAAGVEPTTTPTGITPSMRLVVTPAAVLLTAPGETRNLVPTVPNGSDGNTAASGVTWSSSDPAVATVDASGVVRAVAEVGTAIVTAAVGEARSDPVYVTIAQPVAGAILIEDTSVVAGPTAVDPTAEPAADATYEVVLRGVAAPGEGSILIGTGGKTVGGRVVSSAPEGDTVRVRLRAAPPGELFARVEFEDSIDLASGPLEIDPELTAAYDITDAGGTLTFTPKSSSSGGSIALARWTPQDRVVVRAAAGAVGTHALPPFKECKTSVGFGSGLPLPLSLSVPPTFSFSPSGQVTRSATSRGTRITLQATPRFVFQSVLQVASAFEAKIECKVTLGRRPFRVPGWAGLFFGGDVEFGVGFEVGGKVTLVSAKVGGKAEVNPTIEATLDCPTGVACTLGGNVTAASSAEPVLEGPNLNQARFEPSVNLFVFVELEAGNADLEALQFDAIEAKAGVELAASLSLEGLQIDNQDPQDGRSRYGLAFKGEVGPGLKLGEFLKLLGLEKVVPLKLSFEAGLGESPTGTVSADRAQYLPGEQATVVVALDPATAVFPSGGVYNVERIVLARRNGLTADVLAEVTANDGQTSFSLVFTAPGLIQANEIFAFVVSRLLPLDPPKLELGAAAPGAGGGPVVLQGSVTLHFHEDFGSGISEDTSISATLTVEIVVDDGSAEATVTSVSGTGTRTEEAPSGCNRPPEIDTGTITAGDMSIDPSSGDVTLELIVTGTQTSTSCSGSQSQPFEDDLKDGELRGRAVFTNGVLASIDFNLTETDGGATLMQTGVLR